MVRWVVAPVSENDHLTMGMIADQFLSKLDRRIQFGGDVANGRSAAYESTLKGAGPPT